MQSMIESNDPFHVSDGETTDNYEENILVGKMAFLAQKLNHHCLDLSEPFTARNTLQWLNEGAFGAERTNLDKVQRLLRCMKEAGLLEYATPPTNGSVYTYHRTSKPLPSPVKAEAFRFSDSIGRPTPKVPIAQKRRVPSVEQPSESITKRLRSSKSPEGYQLRSKKASGPKASIKPSLKSPKGTSKRSKVALSPISRLAALKGVSNPTALSPKLARKLASLAVKRTNHFNHALQAHITTLEHFPLNRKTVNVQNDPTFARERDTMAKVIGTKKKKQLSYPIAQVEDWQAVQDDASVVSVAHVFVKKGVKNPKDYDHAHEWIGTKRPDNVEVKLLVGAMVKGKLLFYLLNPDQVTLPQLRTGSFELKPKQENKIIVNARVDRLRQQYDPRRECYFVALAAPVKQDCTIAKLSKNYPANRIIVPNPVGKKTFGDAAKRVTIAPSLVSEFIDALVSIRDTEVEMPRFFFYLDYCATYTSNPASCPAADLRRLFESNLITREGSLIWLTLCARKETVTVEMTNGEFIPIIKRNFQDVNNIIESTGHGVKWLRAARHHRNPGRFSKKHRDQKEQEYYGRAEEYDGNEDDNVQEKDIFKTGLYDHGMYYWLMYVWKR